MVKQDILYNMNGYSAFSFRVQCCNNLFNICLRLLAYRKICNEGSVINILTNFNKISIPSNKKVEQTCFK